MRAGAAVSVAPGALHRAVSARRLDRCRGAGAGGAIGTSEVARAAPDGYTILVAPDSIVSNAHVYKVNYKPLQDFVPVIQISRQPIVLAAHPSLGVKSVADLVALAKRGNKMSVALSDPTNTQALDQIKFQAESSVEPVIVPHDALLKLLETLTKSSTQTILDMSGDEGDIEFAEEEAQAAPPPDPANDVEDAPIVRFLNKILMDAMQLGASDIHFEPYETDYRVRLRIDGILKQVAKAPVKLSQRIAARLKVMAQLDIAEKRVPQDGRIKLNLSKTKQVDFRVSTLPTLFGEKVVLRILDGSAAKLGIDKLGYEKDQQKLFEDAIHKPYGMVLVTGPTGSGKTVSLYTALGILNDEVRNISTVEDPVEIRLPGVNQVQQNTKRGMTFAAALRSFLRQDPDIIMVGEIRDLETAEIAIKAAQTGHMVLSTLHTNDAPQTIARLMNMGIAPYNITSSVTLVIAQRLARRLCCAARCRWNCHTMRW